MLLAYAFGYDSDLLEEEPFFCSHWLDDYRKIQCDSIHQNLLLDFFTKRLQYILKRPLDSKSNLANAYIVAAICSEHFMCGDLYRFRGSIE